MSRYKVVGSAAESEPGSNGLVLSNRLGITDPAVMEVVERDLLLDLYQTTIGNGWGLSIPGQERYERSI